MKRNLSLVLAAVLAANCFPAAAQTVEVPDVPPAVEAGGATSADIADAMAAGPVQTAMLVTVPTDPTADISTAGTSRLPVTAYAGTGQETRLGVDLSAASAQAEREGWPWYGKVAVVVGCALVVGLATWGIVEASHKGSHDQDSSTHYTIYGDDGATMNVRIGSDNSSSSTSTGW